MPKSKIRITRPVIIETLHIFVLSAFAIAQPLFDLFAKQAEFFATRKSEPIDVILLTIFLSLIVPTALALPRWVFGFLSPRLGKLYHLSVVTGLFGLFTLHLLKRLPVLPTPVLIISWLVAVVLLTMVYLRTRFLYQTLNVLIISIPLVPLIFFLNSDIRKIVFPTNQIFTSSGQAIRKTPVVMVVFDELPLAALMNREGEIDGTNFPAFKELADSSTWFRNATTVAAVTNYAIPAMLSGLSAYQRRLPTDADYPQNLFTVLGESHQLYAYESATRLCPRSLCTGGNEPLGSRLRTLLLDSGLVYLHALLPSSLAQSLPSTALRWSHFFSDDDDSEPAAESKPVTPQEIGVELRKDRLSLFQHFINNIQIPDGTRPPLHYLHILLPHTPWKYYASGKAYMEEYVIEVPGLGEKGLYWIDDEWLPQMGLQRFLLQLGAVDKMIGKLLAHLRAISMYDQTLLIVTADHGASFRPRDAYRRFTTTNYPDIMPVPLFMKLPGQKQGRIDDRNFELIDLFPTVAELLSVELGLPMDGHSMLTEQGKANGYERDKKVLYDFFDRWEDKHHVFPAHSSMVAEAVERKYEIFRDLDHGSVYHMGELANLVGKDVSAFRRDTARGTVSIDQASLFEDVDTESSYLPGLITGTIQGVDTDANALPLAIALNDVVVATARAFRNGDVSSFIALLPEEALGSGRNTLSVYLVGRADEEFRLRGLDYSGQVECVLEESADKRAEKLVLQDGEVLPIAPGAVQGFVDHVDRYERTVMFSGWAAELRSTPKRVVDTLIVTVNGRCAFYGRHSGNYRPDIERHHGLPQAGYKLSLSARLLAEDDDLIVRVFGVSKNGNASELAYHDWYKWRKR